MGGAEGSAEVQPKGQVCLLFLVGLVWKFRFNMFGLVDLAWFALIVVFRFEVVFIFDIVFIFEFLFIGLL